jgi:hypothetical protein
LEQAGPSGDVVEVVVDDDVLDDVDARVVDVEPSDVDVLPALPWPGRALIDGAVERVVEVDEEDTDEASSVATSSSLALTSRAAAATPTSTNTSAPSATSRALRRGASSSSS